MKRNPFRHVTPLLIGAVLLCAPPALAETREAPAAARAYVQAAASRLLNADIAPLWYGEDQVAFVRADENGGWTLESIDAPANAHATLLRSADLADGPAAGARPVAIESGGGVVLARDDSRWRLDVTTRALTPAADLEAAAPRSVRRMFPMYGWDRREDLAPDGTVLATLMGPDVGLRFVEGDVVTPLTQEDGAHVRWFLGGDIWEDYGSIWSPRGRRVIVRRHDESRTPGVPYLMGEGQDLTSERFRYWARTGEPLPATTLAVIDADARALTEVRLSPSHDSYVWFISWRPDGDAFAFVRVARDASQYELFEADARTGAVRLLVREHGGGKPVRWPGGARVFWYLPNGQGFLWRSARSGFSHLYLHEANGRLVRQVTRGAFDAGEVQHIDDTSVTILAGPDASAPYDQQLVRFSFAGSSRNLTPSPGRRAISFAPSGRYFVETHHTDSSPPAHMLKRAQDGALLRTIMLASLTNSAPPPPQIQRFVAKAADGRTDVHGVLMLPPNFDPSRRYPVIERIYGGMQSTMQPFGYWNGEGAHRGDYAMMSEWLAAQGFIVAMMDSPGTPGRGHAYWLARHGSWPDNVIPDHVAVLRELARTRPWMDMTRVGVSGNSWGGMLALRGMIEAPNFYRAASAEVAQTDMIDHVSWSEFQLGDATRNRAAYERAAIPPRVEAIAGDLLIVGATADVNVPFSNTLSLIDALNVADKPHELLLIPGVNHAFEGRGDSYADVFATVANFFKDSLGGPSAPQ